MTKKQRKKMNKIKSVSIILLITVLLVACGKTERENVIEQNSCKISIDCKTILNNMDSLVEEKKDLVPENGVILEEIEVSFAEGESVLDILQRVCREEKILMESSFTAGTSSAYIEGIANLYEFDCGSLSGWEYRVNNESMGVSCSDYKVQDGDVIAWRYTCDMGQDLN